MRYFEKLNANVPEMSHFFDFYIKKDTLFKKKVSVIFSTSTSRASTCRL